MGTIEVKVTVPKNEDYSTEHIYLSESSLIISCDSIYKTQGRGNGIKVHLALYPGTLEEFLAIGAANNWPSLPEDLKCEDEEA